MSESQCPNCEAKFHIDMAAAVGKDQRFSYRVHPEEAGMMQAKLIGGQLIALDDLMRACAKEDGGKVRTYIDRITTHDDGSLEFSLVVLAVLAWDEKKGDFVAKRMPKNPPREDTALATASKERGEAQPTATGETR